jgi:hypothetical protein
MTATTGSLVDEVVCSEECLAVSLPWTMIESESVCYVCAKVSLFFF